jgi:hypothetical protein
MLIDGHLRAETTPDQQVPVLVLDVTEEEADKLLATVDPLAALADANAEALDELLRRIDTGSDALQEMYADLAESVGLVPKDTTDEPDAVPKTGWEVVVTCANEDQQREVFERLHAEGLACRVLTY